MPQMQNRVQETTTTGGTGTLTLAGAVTGYITFASGFSTGTSLFYTIDNGVGEWEIGIGTLVTTGTLSRVTVIASSNGGALVNFGSGTKRVFCSAPTRSLVPDQDSKSGYVLTTDGTNPAWTQTLNGITIGNLTAAGGAFTTLSASSTVSGTGFSTYLASPPAIGGTTPAAGNFTTLGATGNVTLGDAAGDTLTINAGTTTFTQGTANGVLYLNGSKVATSGSALTFDGTNLGVGLSNPAAYLGKFGVDGNIAQANGGIHYFWDSANTFGWRIQNSSNTLVFGQYSGSDIATLTSKGLLVGYTSDASLSGTGNAIFSGNVGIGTSSPIGATQAGSVTTAGVFAAKGYLNAHQTSVGIIEFNANKTSIRSYGATAGTGLIAFNVGGGGGSADTQAMTLDASGNLLVGYTSKLSGGVSGIDVNGSGTTGVTLGYGGAPKGYLFLDNPNSRYQIESASGYTITAVSGGANGVSLANGGTSWGSLSDERSKDIIEPITDAMNKITGLRSVIGKYKTDGESIRRSFLIAQDVQKVLPEAVDAADPEKLGVRYTDTIPLLVAAIKELHAEIETLKQRIH